MVLFNMHLKVLKNKRKNIARFETTIDHIAIFSVLSYASPRAGSVKIGFGYWQFQHLEKGWKFASFLLYLTEEEEAPMRRMMHAFNKYEVIYSRHIVNI